MLLHHNDSMVNLRELTKNVIPKCDVCVLAPKHSLNAMGHHAILASTNYLKSHVISHE